MLAFALLMIAAMVKLKLVAEWTLAKHMPVNIVQHMHQPQYELLKIRSYPGHL